MFPRKKLEDPFKADTCWMKMFCLSALLCLLFSYFLSLLSGFKVAEIQCQIKTMFNLHNTLHTLLSRKVHRCKTIILNTSSGLFFLLMITPPTCSSGQGRAGILVTGLPVNQEFGSQNGWLGPRHFQILAAKLAASQPTSSNLVANLFKMMQPKWLAGRACGRLNDPLVNATTKSLWGGCRIHQEP